MRIVILTLVVLLNFGLALTQDKEFKIDLPVRDPVNLDLNTDRADKPLAATFTPTRQTDPEKALSGGSLELKLALRADQPTPRNAKTSDFDTAIENTAKDPIAGLENTDIEFHWRPAIIQSGLFLGLQHGFRMTEEKTRKELKGPFFADWKASVKNLRGWDDGGKVFTNYIAHPLQGALTGRIFINNSGIARNEEFGRSKQYWKSRLKAMAWSAVWSTQFEIGPISEASLGNVGKNLHSQGNSKMTYGDLVLTPTLGTAFAIAEDAVDKYILKNFIERKLENPVLIKILRSVLTPTTSFANLLRGRLPWRRDFRLN